ncbi:kin of IRRE-like protein 3 [Branchiostoma floridae x Branchiostoma japonicum]
MLTVSGRLTNMASGMVCRLGFFLILTAWIPQKVNGASFRERPEPIAVLRGQTVVMKCAFNGLTGDDAVVWQGGPDDITISFGRKLLKAYTRHAIVGDGRKGEFNLEIRDAQLKDDGKYSCYTHPDDIADATLTVVVPMPTPPTITGGELVVTAEEQLSLTCRTSGGHPAPRLTWLNGTQPFRSATMSTNEDETLELFIPRLTKWDNGANFTCLADQGFPKLAKPKASSRILRVKYPPLVQVPSPSVHVREGEPASLSCMVDSNPKATVTWRKLGDSLRSFNMPRDHVLQIPKASKHDGGLYQCEADNGVSPVGFGTITLQVYYPPVIDASMEDKVTMQFGQDDRYLQCIADGNPKPHIRWRRKDTSLYWGNPLRFHRVRYDVQGTYQCVAASDGFQEVTKDVYVDVVGKPSIHSGLSSIVVAEGNNARFHCEILGDPLPSHVTWFWRNKQSAEVVVMTTDGGMSIVEKATDDGMSSTLLLKDVGISQEGTYICQASNMFGEARREIHLEVTGSPGSLVAISVSMATVVLGIVAAVIVCVAVKKKWVCWDSKQDTSTLSSTRSVPPARKAVKRLGHGTNDSGVEDLELQELDGTLKPRPPPRGDKEWTSVGLSYTRLAHSTTLPPYTTVERHRPDGEDIRSRGGIPEEAIMPDPEYIAVAVPTPPAQDKRRWSRQAASNGSRLSCSVREVDDNQADSI